MAEVETVPASPRQAAGKGSARQARRDGQVPAVIYGNKEDPITLMVEKRILVRELSNPQFYIQLIDVEIEGKSIASFHAMCSFTRYLMRQCMLIFCVSIPNVRLAPAYQYLSKVREIAQVQDPAAF